MRTLKLQMQVSIDGFVAGENGEMDWMTWSWDEPLQAYITELTEPVDCILLGRVLAQGFIDHWKAAAENPETSDASARKFSETPKKVFSKTLQENRWENTELLSGDLVEEIRRLKKSSGGDLIAYGGGNFVSSLIRENLIDEYHLCINPVILGKGMPIFQNLTEKLNLELVNATPFACGITVIHYRKKAI